MRKYKFLFFAVVIIAGVFLFINHKETIAPKVFLRSHKIGDKLDSLNGVVVFYNGSVSHSGKRNVSTDGYNIGMQYQCVEFVKRYYYEYYHHKMPDSYGNAKDFFDNTLADGVYNGNRDLLQYRNSSKAKPQQGDLVIMDATRFNPYGHVAIVSNVTNNSVEIIQQNPGPAALSRVKYDLQYRKNLWRIDNARILGWLRMKTKN